MSTVLSLFSCFRSVDIAAIASVVKLKCSLSLCVFVLRPLTLRRKECHAEERCLATWNEQLKQGSILPQGKPTITHLFRLIFFLAVEVFYLAVSFTLTQSWWYRLFLILQCIVRICVSILWQTRRRPVPGLRRCLLFDELCQFWRSSPPGLLQATHVSPYQHHGSSFALVLDDFLRYEPLRC